MIVFAFAATAVYTFVVCVIVNKQRRSMERERYRLDKVVSDYNRVYKDDYKPF